MNINIVIATQLLNLTQFMETFNVMCKNELRVKRFPSLLSNILIQWSTYSYTKLKRIQHAYLYIYIL